MRLILPPQSRRYPTESRRLVMAGFVKEDKLNEIPTSAATDQGPKGRYALRIERFEAYLSYRTPKHLGCWEATGSYSGTRDDPKEEADHRKGAQSCLGRQTSYELTKAQLGLGNDLMARRGAYDTQ